jgi:hypothetical protein
MEFHADNRNSQYTHTLPGYGNDAGVRQLWVCSRERLKAPAGFLPHFAARIRKKCLWRQSQAIGTSLQHIIPTGSPAPGKAGCLALNGMPYWTNSWVL